MKPWSIPIVHKGLTVAVLGSGPSMSKSIAECLLYSYIPCIVVNSTFRLAPWAWALYAADSEWWQHPDNSDALKFDGLKISCSPVTGVNVLRNAGCEGYSDDLDCVHTFGYSGAQAIQVAVKSGARRVFLFGFDMSGDHWHPEHPHGLRQTPQPLFAKWAKRTGTLAKEVKKRGVEVLNFTSGSKLTCFDHSTLEKALANSVETV